MQNRNETILAELRCLAAMARRGDVALSCWCAPAPCHGEILRAAIGWWQAQMGDQENCTAENEVYDQR